MHATYALLGALAFAAGLTAAPARAAEWRGHLMDTMCAADKLDQAPAHTAECMKRCQGSGFGLVAADGRYIRFDERGNALALAALEKSQHKQDLRVVVEGEMRGTTIRVASIRFDE
jgi:hypothetical protein